MTTSENTRSETGNATAAHQKGTDLGTRSPTFEDIERLTQLLGLSAPESQVLTGMNPVLARKERRNFADDPNAPLNDIGLAIMVRMLLKNPSLCWIPAPVSGNAFLQALQAEQASIGESTVTPGALSSCVGRNYTSGFRWSSGGGHSPVINALFRILELHAQRVGYIQAWMLLRDAAECEAAARGMDPSTEVIKWPRRTRKAPRAPKLKQRT